MSITAIMVMPDGDRRPCLVSARQISPTEIIQIMEQKKLEVGFAYVEEVAFPPGPHGRPRFTGTAESDAMVQIATLAGPTSGRLMR